MSDEFTLENYLKVLNQSARPGLLHRLLRYLSGIGPLFLSQDEVQRLHEVRRSGEIIAAMTIQERKAPKSIDEIRCQQIADHAKVSLQEVHTLFREFKWMAGLMAQHQAKTLSELFARIRQSEDPNSP